MAKTHNSNYSSVYIVDGARTPFLKARGEAGPFSASDLAVMAGKALLLRQPIAANQINEVVFGCMMPSPDEANIGRVISLRLGCGNDVPAYTVQRNCASSLQSIDSGALTIMQGQRELVLAGGTEVMSRAPLLYSTAMVQWLADFNKAKTMSEKIRAITQFRLSFLSPVIALLHGLSDPIVGLNMGQTAENVAHYFNITRTMMDEYAVQSHHRLAAAQDNHYLEEIAPIFDNKGNFYLNDDGLRRDSTVEKLATLKPYFDKPYGLVTAANSSQISDGACVLLLASKEAVVKYQLPVLGRIIDLNWAALDPAYMGLGPAHAIAPLLNRQKLKIKDIDYWEINEAFAGQVIGCVEALDNADYCKKKLGLTSAMGQIDMARLNVDGGAISLGHPVGASGARIVLHLLHVLKRQQARYGVASLCIGGGQGGAVLLENMTGVE